MGKNRSPYKIDFTRDRVVLYSANHVLNGTALCDVKCSMLHPINRTKRETCKIECDISEQINQQIQQQTQANLANEENQTEVAQVYAENVASGAATYVPPPPENIDPTKPPPGETETWIKGVPNIAVIGGGLVLVGGILYLTTRDKTKK